MGDKTFKHLIGKSDALSEMSFSQDGLQYHDKICFDSKVVCYRLLAVCMNLAVARNSASHMSLNESFLNKLKLNIAKGGPSIHAHMECGISILHFLKETNFRPSTWMFLNMFLNQALNVS